MSNDVERRFSEHNNGKGGHYTKARKAVQLLYVEQHQDRGSALRREAQIKGWRREKKLHLITSTRTSSEPQSNSSLQVKS